MGRNIVSKDGEPLAHCELAKGAQRKARAVLRHETRANPDFMIDNLSADVIIEQVWNALVMRETR